METKTVYLYDTQGYYAGPHTLNSRDDKTPVTKEWIIPANSTEVPMTLPTKAHYVPAWNGTAWVYVEDKNNPPEPEKPEPTPEEEKQQKLDALDAQYNADKAELINAYTDAIMHDDQATADSLRDEMLALDEQYDIDYEKIINGED